MSYSWEAYPKHGTYKALWEAPLTAQTELKLVFPWFVCDHRNNLPVLFEVTEENCPSILSPCLTTFDWPPSTEKSKELQEKEHGYSTKTISLTAGKGQINQPLLSFTEMLSSQETAPPAWEKQTKTLSSPLTSRRKDNWQMRFSVNCDAICNTTDLAVLSKEAYETAESSSHPQHYTTALPAVAWLSSLQASHPLLTMEWMTVLHNCYLWLKMFKLLYFSAWHTVIEIIFEGQSMATPRGKLH